MSSLVEYSSVVFSRRLEILILLLPVFVGFIGFTSLLNEWLSALIHDSLDGATGSNLFERNLSTTLEK